MYRLVRKEFNYNPVLLAKQFLSEGFAERKMLMVMDVVAACQRKHNELYRLSNSIQKCEKCVLPNCREKV